MKFEKQTRRVTYVDGEDIYRVTFDPVNRSTRTPKDSKKHLVCIAAAVGYWAAVDKRSHCLGCARSVREAWMAGDRYLLDTDKARSAAELVSDLANTRPDDIDISSALSDLLNAIAEVRLSDIPMDGFDVLPICKAVLDKCFVIEGFNDWSPHAKRRRFLYELSRRDRTPVIYTLAGLYFKDGTTPILTLRQKQELLSLDRGEGPDGALRYFDDCLRQITAYRFS